VNPAALKFVRESRGLSQKQLAQEATAAARAATGDPNVGVSVSTIAMTEVGDRQFSLPVAEWVAKALGVDVSIFATVTLEGSAA
jgi:transcriptional regulator with XRE-family HTH domain